MSGSRPASINIVLIRSEGSENVGAAARALANMGGTKLILVEPQCSIDERARMYAAGAQSTLEEIEIFDSWSRFREAYPRGLLWAFSRRSGVDRPVRSLSNAVEQLALSQSLFLEELFLIFGPEAHGLKTKEVERAHCCISLEVFGEFKSLNLSQAVLLALYQLQMDLRARTEPLKKNPSEVSGPALSNQQIEEMENLFKEWLQALGFDWQARRASAFKALRRAFLASHPSVHDFHVLKSIFQLGVRKITSS